MTTLENRPNTALLVVDVQNGVVAGAHQRDEVVTNIAGLVEKARREQVPIVWVQHSDPAGPDRGLRPTRPLARPYPPHRRGCRSPVRKPPTASSVPG
ncbi:MAG: cysteine hydrolase family protein [Actinomycetota bacterium]